MSKKHLGEKQAKRPGRKLTAALGAVAVVAVAAAAVLGVLYARAYVPSDAAAKVDDEFVSESDVADYISQARIAAGTTDDADFATYLLQNSLNVTTYRNNCVNQLALNMLINNRAEELNLSVKDSEVDEQVDSYKESLAFGDDGIWADTLEQQGMTEAGLREQIRTNLLEQELNEEEVDRRDATDAETLSYVQSSMAGQTLKHSYRLAFTGTDGWEKAQKAYRALKGAGSLDADTFASFAEQYASDDDSGLQQGSFGWSDATDMPEGYSDVLAGLHAGELSELTTVDGDDATEIVFCDVEYTFPDSSKISKLKLKDLPDSLRSYMADQASDSLYSSDCSSYLAWLLARAKITYYPVPDDAAYNVDMSKAGTSSSDGSTSKEGE